MSAEFQSWAAIAVVVGATLWLTIRSVRSKGGGHGSCGSCGCDVKDKLKGK